MRLDRIALHNFLSHPDTDFVLDGARLVSLVGSNGAGKSSLLDAVAFALFDAARGRTDDLVRLGSTDMSARVEFTYAGARYAVTRGRTTKAGGKSFLELAIAGPDGTWRPLTAEGIRETQAAIAELLRVDADTFLTAVLLQQGQAMRFAEATAGARKAILGTVLGLDVYGRAEALARDQVRTAEARIEAERAELARLEEQLAGRPALEAGLAEAERLIAGAKLQAATLAAERDRHDATIKAADLELARFEQAARDVAAIEGRLAALRERYRRAKERREAAAAAIATAEAADDPQIDEAIELLPEARAELAALEATEATDRMARATLQAQRDELAAAERTHAAALAAWQAERDAAAARAEELGRAVESVIAAAVPCPKCGTLVVAGAGDLPERRDAAAAEARRLAGLEPKESMAIARARAAIVRAELKLPDAFDHDAVPLARRHVADLERTAARAEARDERRATIVRDQATIAGADLELASIDAEGKAAAVELTAKKALAGQADPIRVQRAEAAAAHAQVVEAEVIVGHDRAAGAEALGRARAGLEALDRVAIHHDELRAGIASTLGDVGILRRLMTAFGPTGIPARIIESVLPELGAHAQELLDALRPGMTLELRAQRAKRDGSGIVEALDLIVRDDAGERPLALFSGGERMSVSLAIAVGLSRLIARRAGTALRTLVIDEPDGLDAEARRAFGQALRILAHHGELERVVLVSHHEDLAEVGDAIYQVRKGDAGSVVSQIG